MASWSRPEDYKVIRKALVKARVKYEVRITIDCALSFLMSKEDPKELMHHGVYGCTGARRFLSIHPDGRAYPCSFLNMPEYCGGNAKDGLSKVWRSFQSFRSINERMSGNCGKCTSREFCMGCRAIAMHETGDILSGDPGCIREYGTLA